MRHIERLVCPDILSRKHDEWQQKFDEKRHNDSKARPDNSKYAHKDIRRQLSTMSFGKCFYCESLLSNSPKEVDHFIEVAIDSAKAYTWENLYLSCSNCNDKLPHNQIPVDSALDPCRDSDEFIRANISFDKEFIVSVPGSPMGDNTIKKFRLSDEQLDNKRMKWLRIIDETVRNVLINMIKDGRKKFNKAELSLIESFKEPCRPYSYMSEVYIDRMADLKDFM